MFCSRCGVWNADNANFCRRCGAKTGVSVSSQPTRYPSPYTLSQPLYPSAARGADDSRAANPYFIWSIVLFFCLNVLGTPLAAAGAVCASRAHAVGCADSDEKIASAKMFCVAATVIDVATLAVMILLSVIFIMHKGAL